MLKKIVGITGFLVVILTIGWVVAQRVGCVVDVSGWPPVQQRQTVVPMQAAPVAADPVPAAPPDSLPPLRGDAPVAAE